MSQDEPNQPVDSEAVPLADLIEKSRLASPPMRVVEADIPEKLKRKPKPYFPNLRLYLIVAIIAVVVTALIGSAFFVLAPMRVVPMTVPVVITATPLPYPWPTPTAAFGNGIGMGGYDYLTMQDLPNGSPSGIPAYTRVRLSSAWFDGQQWHYQIVPQDEQSSAEALESQLISLLDLTLTPTLPPFPTPPPTPTLVR